MSLLLPGGPSFSDCTDNMTGTPPAVLTGTNFTAGANSTDSTVAPVLAALSHDVHYLVIGVGGVNGSNVDSTALLDVMVDPAGGTSWTAWINDLVVGYTASPGAGQPFLSLWYHFPIFLLAGNSVGVRAKTTHTSNITAGRVGVWAFGEPQRPDMWWCGSQVEMLGFSAGSKGTSVTPGASGTYGSWTTIGTSTARYQALQFQINGEDAAGTALGYYWQVGAGSQQLRGTPTIHTCASTAETMGRVPPGPIFCDVPPSTTLQMRATASGAGPAAQDVAVYGVI